jgi:hypothetical protein
MAVSRTDLANQALGLLVRDSFLRDLDGSSPAAVQMKFHMQSAIEEVIAAFDWPECRVVTELVIVPDIALRGFTYAHVIPPDCVRVWRVSDSRGELLKKFEIGMSADITSDTNYIYTEDADLSIRYGSRRVSIGRFTPDVIALIALRLAIKTCMVLTKNSGLLGQLRKDYRMDLSEAKTIAANLEPELIDIEFVPETILVRSS